MATTVYKVLVATFQDDAYVLRSATTFEDGWWLAYSEIHRNLPIEGSYLYAFSTLEYAIEYIKPAKGIMAPFGALQIWEASSLVPHVVPWETKGNYADFWQRQLYAEDAHSDLVYPCQAPGTVWCKYIDLKRKVYGPEPKKDMKKKRY